MGARIRALDWEKSPLGPISSWPQSKSTVDLMMASQLAMNLIWGPGRIQIYNDTNRAFLGTKHPNALGRPGREDFSEVWEAAEALLCSLDHGLCRADLGLANGAEASTSTMTPNFTSMR